MQTSSVHTRMNTGFLIETTKGQITIPADVRNTLKLDAGYRVEFVQIAPDRFEVCGSQPQHHGTQRHVRQAQQAWLRPLRLMLA
jgi:AbrB family looped-hinge helix DNA binding protein